MDRRTEASVDAPMKKGKKADQGKTRFDLIDPKFIEEIAKVMTIGASKYSSNNWQHVNDFTARYTAATHRHINAWQQGELMDQESQLPHLAHAASNLMFLLWQDRGGKYENKELPRERPCGPSECDTEPGEYCKGSPYVDHEQAAALQRGTILAVIEILDSGKAHESFRARLNALCSDWYLEELARTDNPASCRELHERKSTLRGLPGHAVDSPF